MILWCDEETISTICSSLRIDYPHSSWSLQLSIYSAVYLCWFEEFLFDTEVYDRSEWQK